jgi:hypothetical protein
MKKLLTLTALTATIFGFNAEVKKSDITLTINGTKKELKKGDKFSLNGGDIICYKSGDGRVVITNKEYRKQLSKRASLCTTLPTNDKSKDSFLASVKEKIANPLSKTKETKVSGVSRKALESELFKDDITIDKNQKYLQLKSEDWGPLPVTLTILDKNGKPIHQESNEDNDITLFLIPTTLLKDGFVVKVTNSFDEEMVSSKVMVK